eukprot:10674282-Alexandrium_andersonii.AAC.1
MCRSRCRRHANRGASGARGSGVRRCRATAEMVVWPPVSEPAPQPPRAGLGADELVSARAPGGA